MRPARGHEQEAQELLSLKFWILKEFFESLSSLLDIAQVADAP
jgi:hypothetical protein